jgi:hypothetical protein
MNTINANAGAGGYRLNSAPARLGLPASAWAHARPANPGAGLSRARPMFHPLLEERAGVRSSFSTDLAFKEKFCLTPSAPATTEACLVCRVIYFICE